jgi:tRNA pseudouridine55 synthase
MEGILNILKPSGMTSFDVVAYIRKKTGAKAGHAGTLDPAAAGVLPVCVGKATRLIEYMSEMRKVYRAEMLLGVETDTQDGTGRVVAEHDVNLSERQIIDAFNGFIGITGQIPPMYSAVKVSGKKLYELARKGITIERKKRKIEVFSINVVDIYRDRVLFDVECSKGTYIRTLCHDIGKRLGCGAHLKFLLRKRVGPFALNDSITLEELREIKEKALLPPDEAVKHMDSVTLSKNESLLLSNGRGIRMCEYNGRTRLVRVYNESGVFLAIGEMDEINGILKPRKVFVGGTNEGSI